MEGAGQVVYQILRYVVKQAETYRWDRRYAYTKWGAEEPVESVHSDKPWAYHPAH